MTDKTKEQLAEQYVNVVMSTLVYDNDTDELYVSKAFKYGYDAGFAARGEADLKAIGTSCNCQHCTEIYKDIEAVGEKDLGGESK